MTEKEALKIVANPHLKWKCVEVDSALTIVRNALEKQTPKKPIKVDSGVYDYPFDYECPYCSENVDELDHHCKCGQTLDWSETKLDNFIEECKQPTRCKEYERPKEVDDVINSLVDFDSYSFYQDNIGKLVTYVEELESLIKAITCVVVKPEYR